MSRPYWRDDAFTVYHGDCLDVMATLPDESVDAVVTDPPYLISFMSKTWDTNGIAFDPETWRHCLRLLRPGGHMLAFGGTRTWHRLAAAIEDAGFEIRDNIAWLYGSGFPKSLDASKAIDKAAGAEREVVGQRDRYRDGGVRQNNGATGSTDDFLGLANGVADITAPATDAAKQWQGWGTALKPAFEPIVVARKPIRGTVAANVQAYGTGALNIDACRVEHNEQPGKPQRGMASRRGGQLGGGGTSSYRERETDAASPAGRWPTNVVIDDAVAAGIDEQSGVSTSRAASRGELPDMRGRQYAAGNGKRVGGSDTVRGHDDEGGASRFFPTFKYQAKADTAQRPSANGIAHPTVKPLDLMRWLIRLVTPPHGLVLDPFAGTGTTAEAAIHEHMSAIVIEQEADYLPVIVARLHKPMQVGFDFDIGELDT